MGRRPKVESDRLLVEALGEEGAKALAEMKANQKAEAKERAKLMLQEQAKANKLEKAEKAAKPAKEKFKDPFGHHRTKKDYQDDLDWQHKLACEEKYRMKTFFTYCKTHMIAGRTNLLTEKQIKAYERLVLIKHWLRENKDNWDKKCPYPVLSFV